MKGFGIYLLVLMMFLAIATAALTRQQDAERLKYSDILDYFNDRQVAEFQIDDNVLKARLKDGTKIQYRIANLDWFYFDLGQTILEQQKEGTLKEVDYTIREIPWWMGMVPYGIILVLMVLFWYFMMNKQDGGGRGPMQFGRARAKLAQDDKKKVTFQDVAGADEEKTELQEIVEFLKNPKKFVDLGARIPKGVLLVGPPGTGKTLLAKAVAGEAGVPFLSISGSDFVELYVGVGASRVRDLFDQAKKNSPAIVFIDEIDAVGRQRGAGLGGGHDEREQTLNQLLVEMDGFGANEGVIIIAATNRPDILDRALLRPGRFDRQVYVGAPDVKGREEILNVHAKNKQFDPDVDLNSIAKGTVGMTGADLENLLNEAALLAARRNKKLITNDEIEEALLKVEMGPEKKSRVVSEKKKRIVAYHEAGHAVAHHAMGTLDPIHYITIIPRGGAGGFTMWRPQEEGGLETKSYFEDSLVTALGGRVAEKLIFNEITTGASGDIRQATAMARAMVVNYGMSDKIGTVDYGDSGEVFIGRDFGATHSYSENKAAEIDGEVHRIIDEAYNRCVKILTEHDKQLHDVAEYLLRNETMDGEVFVKIFNGEVVPDKTETVATPEELKGSDEQTEQKEEIKEEIAKEETKDVNISKDDINTQVSDDDKKD